jgi:hypothetical protein
VINPAPGRQVFMCARTWTDQGRPAPIAWVIAAEPAVHLATVANLKYGQDEIAQVRVGVPSSEVHHRSTLPPTSVVEMTECQQSYPQSRGGA